MHIPITLLKAVVHYTYNIKYIHNTVLVHITAKVSKIVFNPSNPSEPDSSQDNVQTTLTGDVNKDGAIDVLDIVAVVNYSLKESDENLSTYDITGDGVVDILDIVRVVNLSLE